MDQSLQRHTLQQNRIHRIMKALYIHFVIRKKAKKHMKSTPETTAENLLKRESNSTMPTEK